MLWGQHHVSRAKKRIRPGSEYPDCGIVISNSEIHFGAFASSNPIPLHFLERVAPVDCIQVIEQSFGIGSNEEHPLMHRLFVNGKGTHFPFSTDPTLPR